MMMPNKSSESGILSIIRGILLVSSVISLIGIGVELVILNHLNPILQLIPVFLIVLGLGSIIWYAISRNGKSMRIFQGTMALCVISGLIGIFLHVAFSASEASKKDKTLHGMQLFQAAIKGIAPPLAPGAMIQLGLIGLAYTYRHPAMDDALVENVNSITRE
jgi:hypothetical protein